MVLATEIMIPPRPRSNSFHAPEAPKSPTKSSWWFFPSKLKASTDQFGSNHTIATQKLRESKWFNQDEERLFCAVIESGFIVEMMHKEQSTEENKSHYGVVSVEAKKSEFYRVVLFAHHLSLKTIWQCLCQAGYRYVLNVSQNNLFRVTLVNCFADVDEYLTRKWNRQHSFEKYLIITCKSFWSVYVCEPFFFSKIIFF